MPERPTFDDAPMRAVDSAAAGHALWQVFITAAFPDGETVQVEYVVESHHVVSAIEKANQDVARAHEGEDPTVIEVRAKQLPPVLK